MDYNKIKKAVDNMIEKQDRLEYFLKSADKEEVIELLKEYG